MTEGVPLLELAEVIRSKNAGPYELTFDIIFKDFSTYERVKKSGFFTTELIARLYKVSPREVLKVVEFDAAKAIKATIVRPRGAGDVGETDVYGAQQHAPLLDLKVPLPPEVTCDHED